VTPAGAAPHAQRRHRLALGIEALDHLSGARIPPPLHVLRDDAPLAGAELARLALAGDDVAAHLPRLERHRTCRHVIRYHPGLHRPGHTSISVRLVESVSGMGRRHFVPRRLRVPLLDPATADDRDTALRIRRPVLFPGAAYPVQGHATGVRARVVRGEKIVRWARIEALRPGGGPVLARAQGDDRGEFLLVLGPGARPVGEPTVSLEVELRIFGPEPAPDPASDPASGVDGLWDLPVEPLPEGAGPEPVARGEAVPAGYVLGASRIIEVPLGRIVSLQEPFDIE
jgi:hypothetical protein